MAEEEIEGLVDRVQETAPAPTTPKVKTKRTAKRATRTPRNSASSLVIVESPAKARTLGNILGKKYDVRASVGHVRPTFIDATDPDRIIVHRDGVAEGETSLQ